MVDDEPPAAPRSREVLVLEDHVGLHRPMRRMLAQRGLNAIFATTAEEASSILDEARSFALFVTDSDVPGGGVAAIVARFLDDHPEASVVVCSGHPFEAAGLGAAPGARVHYLEKPFDAVDMDAVLSRIQDAARLFGV